ncbi:MAG: trypsin-like peptidase domain-containing protein [Actinomycetota bacterium]
MARLAEHPEIVAPDQTSDEDPEHLTRRPVRSRWIVVGVILFAVAAALALRAWDSSGPAPITKGEVDQSIKGAIDAERKARLAAPADATVAHQVIRPSLVYITTERAVAGGTSDTEVASGAGVIINADGTVLTALHVVSGATKITTRFADGTEAGSTIASRQPASDIAVLKVDRLPEVVVPAVLGGGARVGDPVFAVGHPLGLADSLSAGVVSALGRSVRADVGATLHDLIQFDAAVNPGSSGGPLLNRGGQVIGIVTGLANPSKQAFFVGIGFAVPIATAGGVAGSPSQ